MKKFLFSALLFAAALAPVMTAAQNVTLNVRLHPIQTLVVNPAQKTVDLNYVTKENYANGVSVDQNDHLSIYSTGAFVVKVRSGSAKLTRATAGIEEVINASDIKITPSLGSSQLAGTTLKTVSLSTSTEDILISNTEGGIDKTFNIKYAAAGGGSYVNKYVKTETPTVYSTTVIYTIEAK